MTNKPTDAELEILQVLWQEGPCTVRQVNDSMNLKREVGYTTTLKFMQIMFEKGLLTREDGSKSHVYAPAFEESAMKAFLVRQFVNNAFQGSATQLVLQALGNHGASQTELDEIKALIEKIEQERDEG